MEDDFIKFRAKIWNDSGEGLNWRFKLSSDGDNRIWSGAVYPSRDAAIEAARELKKKIIAQDDSVEWVEL